MSSLRWPHCRWVPEAARPCSVGVVWIPAFAGMTVRSDNRIGVDGVIPALAGMTVGGLRAYTVRTVMPACRGNDGRGRSGWRRADHHSRLSRE